jgi:hypothetical protein
VLFGGNSTDRAEIEAAAAEARRLRPTTRIFIRPPMGVAMVECRLPDGDGFEIADAAAEAGAKTLVMSGTCFRCRAAGPINTKRR